MTSKILGAFGALVLMVGVAHAEAAKEAEPFGRLSVDEVQTRIEKKAITVYDNNGDERYKKGHVPTAKLLHTSDATAKDFPADKSAALVFYCGNEMCNACHDGAKKAIEHGYKNVFIMPAGIAGWEKAGKPVEKG
jgi:rhodanese-related sulfurtransferase